MAKLPDKNTRTKPDMAAPRDTKKLMLHAFIGAASLCAVIAVFGSYDVGTFDLRDMLHGIPGPAVIVAIAFLLIAYVVSLRAPVGRHSTIDQAMLGTQHDTPAMFAAFKVQIDEIIAAENAKNIQSRDNTARSISDAMNSISAVEQRVDRYLGAAHEKLIAENDSLKSEINERNKVVEMQIATEIESLRKINSELQHKITTWAIDSVETKLERASLHVA